MASLSGATQRVEASLMWEHTRVEVDHTIIGWWEGTGVELVRRNPVVRHLVSSRLGVRSGSNPEKPP